VSQDHTVALFVGPPGAGKGSLSGFCRRSLGWEQLSTGDLLRKCISEGSELGKQIDFIIKSGKLVSDELINSMVEQWLIESCGQGMRGVILDGYPRTVAQAKSLCEFVEKSLKGSRLKVVRFLVEDTVAVERISARFVCTNKDCQAVYSGLKNSAMKPREDMKCAQCGEQIGKRQDDKESVVKDRLITYRRHEKDLLDFYRDRGNQIIECDAAQPLDELFNEFKTLMNIR